MQHEHYVRWFHCMFLLYQNTCAWSAVDLSQPFSFIHVEQKAPLLFRALPILNSILPGKIREAQSATKMHIRRLAMGLARDAIKEAYSNDNVGDGRGGGNSSGHMNDSKTRLLRRNNLLSDLGG